ncbi:MAG TPA: ribonuclease E inhibitor RraB [Tepidisphaeraceae bacterium]|nr:ribonuclease E inhibitor RraB [Tepidisphaeraceae bacterium]
MKKKLRDADDDEQALHVIDHRLLADTQEALTSVIAVARTLLAFQSTPIRPVETEGKTVFSCYLRTPGMTVLPLLSRQSILMVALAKAFGCKYSGWGTYVVKKSAAPASPPTE